MAYDPDHEWVARAACVQDDEVNLEDYFPGEGASPPAHLLRLCLDCPVRRDCLEHAIGAALTAGWFGGLSPSDRKALTPGDLANF